MRLFKYKVYEWVRGSEGEPTLICEDHIIVNNPELTEQEIEAKIKEDYPSYRNIVYDVEISEIKQI